MSKFTKFGLWLAVILLALAFFTGSFKRESMDIVSQWWASAQF